MPVLHYVVIYTLERGGLSPDKDFFCKLGSHAIKPSVNIVDTVVQKPVERQEKSA